jgi:hypothetical protein
MTTQLPLAEIVDEHPYIEPYNDLKQVYMSNEYLLVPRNTLKDLTRICEEDDSELLEKIFNDNTLRTINNVAYCLWFSIQFKKNSCFIMIKKQWGHVDFRGSSSYELFAHLSESKCYTLLSLIKSIRDEFPILFDILKTTIRTGFINNLIYMNKNYSYYLIFYFAGFNDVLQDIKCVRDPSKYHKDLTKIYETFKNEYNFKLLELHILLGLRNSNYKTLLKKYKHVYDIKQLMDAEENENEGSCWNPFKNFFQRPLERNVK